MISDGIGGIIFSKNIAKNIVKYAIIEFVSTALLIYSGMEVNKLQKIKLKFNIYIVLFCKVPQQKH